MVFPVVMYGCESWTVKKAERWRIDAFELWCWRWLLRVPWTARRSNQFILKEISPGCSLKGLMLKLKLQYFGHLMRRVDSLETTLSWEGLEAGGKGDNRGWDGWMASPTRWTWVWVNSRSWCKLQDREPWHVTIHGVAKSQTQLSYWTELKWSETVLVAQLCLTFCRLHGRQIETKCTKKCNVFESSQNHPPQLQFMEKLYLTKSVPDAKKFGDCCIRGCSQPFRWTVSLPSHFRFTLVR